MTQTEYAKGVTAEDLRLLLAYWPQLEEEGKDIQPASLSEEDLIFAHDTEFLGWCHFYELPIREHLTLSIAANVELLGDFLSMDQVGQWFDHLKESSS